MAYIETLNGFDIAPKDAVRAFAIVADMQAATDLDVGVTCHTNGFHAEGDGGAAYYSIGASGDIACADGLYATMVNAGAKQIGIDELATAPNGTYTLGTVTVTDSVQFTATNKRGLVIVDTVFNIDTPVLFPADFATSFFVLPTFLNCTFNNVRANNARVVITSGANNTVGAKFIGCRFANVDLATNTPYVQDMNFNGCYVQSHTCFIESTGTVQLRFFGTNVEGDSNQIVSTGTLHAYLNGVIEGNSSKDFYFFDFTSGLFALDGAWVEGSKLANIAGSTEASKKTQIAISESVVVAAGNTAVVQIADASNTYMQVFNSLWSPYNANSRFTNAKPSDFAAMIGTFIHQTASGYNYPFGGENDATHQTASQHWVVDFLSKSIQEYDQINLLASPLALRNMPVGIYRVMVARMVSGSMVRDEYLVMAGKAPSTTCVVTKTADSSDGYLRSVSITASKAQGADSFFALDISATGAAEYWVTVTK